MSKSKRKREVVYARKFKIGEDGIQVPEHLKALGDPRKHFRLEEYKSNVGILIGNLNNLYSALNIAKHHEEPIPVDAFNNLTLFNLRNGVIQYFVILDEMVNSILTQYQSDLRITSDKIENFEKVDEGIKKFHPEEKRSSDFNKQYSRIKHFRTLRHQFAHYKYGFFYLEAKQESFESFLNNLDGITLTTEGGFHCYINGKPGMILPYQIENDEFFHQLLKEGTNFFKLLLATFFFDETDLSQ
jgi:hypothetical protein